MQQVGKLMDMQVKIDDLLEAKKAGRDTKGLETEIREAYKEVQEYKGIAQKNGKGIYG